MVKFDQAIRATPHKSARRHSRRFCARSKLQSRRNTVCISQLCNYGAGAKDSLWPADAFVRCCLNYTVKREKSKGNQGKLQKTILSIFWILFMDTKCVDTKISTGAVEKCALCSRMRQASAASTIPSTAGAKKASDHAFHVTIFGNTGMPMVRSSRWLGIPVFLSCPIAILLVWICFCGNYPNNFRWIPFWCAAMELHGTNREHWKCLILFPD